MEDILKEIISLSEKKKKEGKGMHEHVQEENCMNGENSKRGENLKGGKLKCENGKERKHNDDLKKKKKKKKRGDSFLVHSEERTDWGDDASTICPMEDDISIEKANIFSRIINNNKTNEYNVYFKDIEKNVDENTPLFHSVSRLSTSSQLDSTTQLDETNPLNTYLLTVNDINMNIANIYKNIDKINVIKRKIDLNIYDNEKLYTKVNVIINSSEEIINYIKIKINQINKDNENFEKGNNSGSSSHSSCGSRSSTMLSEIKLRVNIFIDVVNKYKCCINKYKNICNHYYEHVNKNIMKHYKLIHPNISDHSIHKLLKQSNYTIEDFLNINNTCYNNNMYCTDIEQIQIEKVKEKYKQLKKLEKNISALNELYIELAYVIKKRKNIINDIENNTFQMKEYTDDALLNIIEAKRYNALIKQKIVYFSVFLLIIAFIILCPVFFNVALF
ncbi:syntaxin, Qa-SNARE family, putative [Plasmodium malariae]|uniref:Syntaxin, Qa-SNARE family, putative n=1 Tax=Plasmodium malariae TaxID=5858 RepID=A0A1C3KEW6_PLAMA|nr:syntaxin, Qa-SNARE family, putative [Plasmodium malariae]